MLEGPVRGLGGAVAGAGAVEVGQDVLGPLRQRPSERAELGECGRDAGELVAVSTYDFPSAADGKAIPYGVYDITDDSAYVVAKILHAGGYSLQGTRKTLEGAQHPDRDDQFRYIHDVVGTALAAGEPVISVDTKKKELIGRFA